MREGQGWLMMGLGAWAQHGHLWGLFCGLAGWRATLLAHHACQLACACMELDVCARSLSHMLWPHRRYVSS